MSRINAGIDRYNPDSKPFRWHKREVVGSQLGCYPFSGGMPSLFHPLRR